MFLWRGCSDQHKGCSDQHKTCWLSWKQVCLPKNKTCGAFEYFSFEQMKVAVSRREKNALWYDLLKFKYGLLARKVLRRDGSMTRR